MSVGKLVALAGLGSRFNGNAYVSGVHHNYTSGRWRTTCELGLSASWFAATAPQVAAPGAAGQLPPINNLQSGLVKQINKDPDGEYRVLITLPLLQASGAVWARFGSFYASNGVGANFYPEIGDEVVVAFLNGDPRYPVILGSLYSAKNIPPYPPTDGDSPAPNDIKSFMTKSKLHINFTESTGEILLKTPKNQSISINDEKGSITLTDKNGNTLTMDSGGIALKSATDIKLTATGSITLKADSAITLTADTSLTATGSASAKLNSDGPIQVKGATVALNP